MRAFIRDFAPGKNLLTKVWKQMNRIADTFVMGKAVPDSTNQLKLSIEGDWVVLGFLIFEI